ncbi:ABC-type phosphate/phosphonate transport system, permease component [Serratia entomophila]|nr:ABC-type phosphate/phosphonate transport system, permease component [Serratia entomophila]
MNTDFAQYYQRIRGKQKREALLWSLGLVALYLGAGNLAEFNLHTVWVSIPHFFDYLAETVPTLHWSLLFADGHTEGSLAYWGYRLNIQLPLIWETLQLALAATILSVMVAGGWRFWRPTIPTARRRCAGAFARWWRFCAPCRSWRGR